MRILSMVDHKWRDLPGLAWFAELAEARGHRVAFARNGFHFDAAWSQRPDVVIVNHLLHPDSLRHAVALGRAGIDTVVMPTEGIPTLQGVRDLHAGVGADYSAVARFCVWNEAMRERMIAARVLPPERVPVVGVPRFDVYRPPLDGILPSRAGICARLGFDPEQPLALWCTNFCAASTYCRRPDFNRNDWRALGLERTLGDADEFSRADVASRERSAELVERLLANRPRLQLVIKPHPGEDEGWWREFAARLPRGRVAVLQTAYIWELLPSADVLIKRSCTTGAEAWILGIPTVELQPIARRHYFSEEHAAGSHLADDAASLLRWVDAALAREPIPPAMLAARRAFLDRWCFRDDGRSTERFIDVLDGLEAERRAAGRAVDAGMAGPSFARRLRYRALVAGDHWLHDRRLFGLRSRRDALGRMDKWYRHRDARAWRARLRPFAQHVAAEGRAPAPVAAGAAS